MRLEGKAAIVTGGTSGIGKAIAERFLAEGAEVVVFGLKNPHGVPGFVRVDVSDEKQVRAALASIKRLDILVNNAGIYAQASVEETTEEQLDRIIGVNFKGT